MYKTGFGLSPNPVSCRNLYHYKSLWLCGKSGIWHLFKNSKFRGKIETNEFWRNNVYHSKLFSFKRKSYTLITKIPSSVYHGAGVSLTTIIFLKESLMRSRELVSCRILSRLGISNAAVIKLARKKGKSLRHKTIHHRRVRLPIYIYSWLNEEDMILYS